MIVFISYASEQREPAEEIVLALRGEHHDVFFDRSQLPEGDAYNAKIREAVLGCDLFVFLVSPEAVSEGRYTLTELKFAEEKWPSPVGHVLPVVVRPTDKGTIPAYLRAVVMVRPRGNVAAEVVAAVARLSRPWWLNLFRRYAVALIGIAVLGGGAGVWRACDHRRTCDEASRLVEEARLQQGAGDYAAAWDRFAGALASCPSSDDAEIGRERLAMEWLDNIRVTEGKETFTDIVNKVQPSLTRGAVMPDDRRAGNALAHLGWADFLRTREGAGGLDPVRYYRQAVARDPQNPFAHAMWAHHILWINGSVEQARDHFGEALASGLERPYVRRMQLYAYLLRHDPEGENEAMSVLGEMRLQGDPLPSGPTDDGLRSKIWNLYYGRLVSGYDAAGFLAAPAPSDSLATFRWLFPEGAVSEDKRHAYLFMLAQLQEHGGHRAEALAAYESLLIYLEARKLESSMAPKAKAAIKRLRSG